MKKSFIEIHKPIDPHLRRWMFFVDGENFTIRAQKVAKGKGITLHDGAAYRKDIFVWVPGIKPTRALTNTADAPMKVQDHAIRSYYYTSLTGDEPEVLSVKQALWSLGFHPEVFKKVERTIRLRV